MAMPTRPLGRTGANVSILCFGGWHCAQPELTDDQSIRLVQRAADSGFTFFDNAWDYHEGRSEELMGRALAEGGRRKNVTLMTKNCARDAAGTRTHLEESLKRLRTDYLDLWQFHEINYDNDPDWIVEKGALAEALKAQKEGKVRFIGFTGHKSTHIFQKMLPVHTWDTVQLPVNVCDYWYRSNINELLPALADKGIGAIGMKSLGGGSLAAGGVIPANGVCDAEAAIRYALSQSIASLVVGIDSEKVLDQDLAVANAFTPMTPRELHDLQEKVKAVATDGRFEPFKSTQTYDGPYHRQQHGFAV
jgi:predicted aldo/keto reductase-like oxidoreductase